MDVTGGCVLVEGEVFGMNDVKVAGLVSVVDDGIDGAIGCRGAKETKLGCAVVDGVAEEVLTVWAGGVYDWKEVERGATGFGVKEEKVRVWEDEEEEEDDEVEGEDAKEKEEASVVLG